MNWNDLSANHSETQRDKSEKPHRAEVSVESLKRMFDSQFASMHFVESGKATLEGFARASEARGFGETWYIDPEYGEGSYWYCLLDEGVAVASMKGSYRVDVKMDTDTMNCMCIGLYGKSTPSYFAQGVAPREEALIGYDWEGGQFDTTLRANDSFLFTSVTFTPKAICTYAQRLGCCPLDIIRAIGMLDGRKDVIGLPPAIQTISSARPGPSYAERYYRTKVQEVLLLLLDGLEKSDSGRLPSAIDEYVIREGCRYIEENIGADLSTKTLSAMLHVSEGKLIDAFKRLKETTPQSYIRKTRVSCAQGLLVDRPGLSIREVAALVGYKNQGSFTDAFRQETGCTPSDYRIRKGARVR